MQVDSPTRTDSIFSASEPVVQQSDTIYRDLIEATGIGYMVLDKFGYLLDANVEFARLTGRESVDQLLGHRVVEWTADHDQERIARQVELCVENRVARNLEIDYAAPDGSETPVEVRLAAVDRPEGLHVLGLCQDIIKHKQSGNRFGGNHQELEMLVAASPPIVFQINDQGQGQFVNDLQWQSLTGRKPQSWSGDGWVDVVHPDDRTEVLQSWHQAVSAKEPWQAEFRVQHADGHSVWVLACVLPQSNPQGEFQSFVGTCTDISIHKAAKNTLSLMNQQILQTMTDGFILADAKGRLVDVNPSYCRMIGYEREQLLKMNIDQLECLLNDRQIEQTIAEILRQRSARFETSHRHRDGHEIELDVSITVLSAGRTDPLLAALVRDRTDSKRAEAALRLRPTAMDSNSREVTQQRAIQRQIRRTERLVSLGTLAAGIAQEINNPMSAAWTAAEAAKTLKGKPEKAGMLDDCLDAVSDAVRRSQVIIENVMRFAREEPCDLNEVVRQAAETTKYYTALHGTTVNIDQTGSLIATVNPAEIEQVLVNLIRNTIQAGDAHSITLTTEQDSKTARIRISDDGSGIAEPDLAHVFDPFFSTSNSGERTGLELAISHGIIADHGGTIDVESQLGIGTRFTINLPIA